MLQLSSPYNDPERHNAQHYRQSDGRTDRQTDDRMMPIADHTASDCVQQYDRLKRSLCWNSIVAFTVCGRV